MRTGLMISLIVIGAAATSLGAWLLVMLRLGRAGGTAMALGVATVAAVLYRTAIQPWQLRWGATDDEASQAMPGDDLLPGAPSSTRAIRIQAPPEAIWPWLVQLGYGRAGWYSYDWIDNDFRSSADRIVPEYQRLDVGDRIPMIPSMGFEVKAVDPGRSIVSLLEDGSISWCVALYPQGDGSTRLVSRWRPRFEGSLATIFMNLLVEPGAFIMEQKMLRTIRDRVEATQHAA